MPIADEGPSSYRVLRENSDEHLKITAYLKEIALKFCDSNFRMLSVGCGDSGLDKKVIVESLESGVSSVRYIGIDPSAAYLAIAEKSLKSVLDNRFSFEIRNCSFDQFNVASTFDLITFIYSLYYIKDPIAAIQRSMSWLDAQGYIVVGLQEDGGISIWQKKYLKHVQPLGAVEFSRALRESLIEHELVNIKTFINVSKIVSAPHELAKPFFEFLLSRSLNENDRVDLMIEDLKQLCTDQDLLGQSVGLILIRSDRCNR